MPPRLQLKQSQKNEHTTTSEIQHHVRVLWNSDIKLQLILEWLIYYNKENYNKFVLELH